MSLTKKLNELMTFTLPTDWQMTDFNLDEKEAESALDELYASLTPEGSEAISPYRHQSPEDQARDRELFPEQYSAHACWNTEENSAFIRILTNVVFYTNQELDKTDDLISNRNQLLPAEVAGSSFPIFELCYSRGDLPPELLDPSPAEVVAREKNNPKVNPALLEAFYELKAKVSAFADDLPPEELRVDAVQCGLLSGKQALVVDSYRSRDARVRKQIGYHMLLAREPHNDGWHVVELHIMLDCTPANAEYVKRDFRQFLDSIAWL